MTIGASSGESRSHDSAGSDTELPDRLGHYRPIRKIGGGGMGVVYAAVDERLERTVAIKRVSRGLTEDPEIRARFWREARILAAIDHPGFVTIHELGTAEDGSLFMVMELVDGIPLTRLLERAWPVAHACSVVREIAAIIGVAHRAGIIHRDIKPDNVLVEPNGAIRVVDFGIARRHDRAGDTVTRTGLVVGTPSFMSPEQVMSRECGPPADVFSLGILLYRLLSGVLPFDKDSRIATAMAVAEGDYRPLDVVRPDLPREVHALVTHCLAPAPDDRPPDGGALAQAIDAMFQAGVFGQSQEDSAAFLRREVAVARGDGPSLDTLSRARPQPPGTAPRPPRPPPTASERTTFPARGQRMTAVARWGPAALLLALAILGGVYALGWLDEGPFHELGGRPVLAPSVILPPRPVLAVVGYGPAPQARTSSDEENVTLEDLGRFLGDAVRQAIDGVPDRLLSLSWQTLQDMDLTYPLSEDRHELEAVVRPLRGPGHVDVVLTGTVSRNQDGLSAHSTLLGTRPRVVWAEWQTVIPTNDPFELSQRVAREVLLLLAGRDARAGETRGTPAGEGEEDLLEPLPPPTTSIDAYLSFLDAQKLMLNGDVTASREALEWALQLDPGFSLAGADLLGILRLERRLDDTVARGQAILEREDSGTSTLSPRVRTMVEAMIRYAAGDSQQAATLLYRLLKRWPYDTAAYQTLLVILSNDLDTADLAEVERLCLQSLRIAPNQEVVLSRLVRSLAWRGRAKEAAEILTNMGIGPDSDRFSINPWALTWLFLGRYEASRRLFRRTLDKVPDDIFATHHLIIIDLLEDHCARATDAALNRIHRIETTGQDANLTWTYSLAFQGLLCQEHWDAARELIDAWQARHGLDPLTMLEFDARLAVARGQGQPDALGRISRVLDTPLDDPTEDRSPLLRQVAFLSNDAEVLRGRATLTDTWATRVAVPSALRNSYRQAQAMLMCKAMLVDGHAAAAVDVCRQAVFPRATVLSEGDLGLRIQAMALLAEALEAAGEHEEALRVWTHIADAGYERLWVTDVWVKARHKLEEEVGGG